MGWLGGERGTVKEGGLGDSLAGVPCHSRPRPPGCCVQLEGASSRGWGLLFCAASPPATALVVPCPCRCKFKTQSGPSLCPTSHRAPLLLFSPNLHTHTHTICTHSSPRVRRHYCPTQQRPRCSTRFLLLISRCFRHFLTTSPIVPRARSGLTRSTYSHLALKQSLPDPKDISVFLLLNTTSFHKENKPVLENFAGCARPKDITSLFTTAVVQSNNKFSCSTRTTRVYQFTFDKFVRC